MARRKKVNPYTYALMGAGVGFMQGLLAQWQQERAQQAELLKEQRLEEIRRRERVQENAFRMQEIAEADKRALERDEKRENRADARSEREMEARMEDRKSARDTQLEAARMSAAPRPGYVLIQDAEGNQNYQLQSQPIPQGSTVVPAATRGAEPRMMLIYDTNDPTQTKMVPQTETPPPGWTILPPGQKVPPPPRGLRDPTAFGDKPASAQEAALAAQRRAALRGLYPMP